MGASGRFTSPIEYIFMKETTNVDQMDKCSEVRTEQTRADYDSSIDDDNVRCITHNDYHAVHNLFGLSMSFIITILPYTIYTFAAT